MTTILDGSALVMAGVDGLRDEQAKITFAMARHAMVDLAQVVNARYDPEVPDRLPPAELDRLRQSLSLRGVKLHEGAEFEEKLARLRSLYEPYAAAIALNLSITLPPWIHPEKRKDNWQAGPWDRAIQARSLAGRVQHWTIISRKSFQLSALSFQSLPLDTDCRSQFRTLRAES